jgi:hypothetical protein
MKYQHLFSALKRPIPGFPWIGEVTDDYVNFLNPGTIFW